MKIRLSELRRLIREALGGEALALYTWEHPSRIKVVLYSPAELLALDWGDRFEIPDSVLRGYAGFSQTDNPCNGAWQVSSIAGVGYGKLLYGLGYSLVPSGRLMPDRYYTTPIAKRAWGKSVSKMQGFPLDDVDNPKTPEKEDDCEVQVPTSKGGPDPVIDVAYEGPRVATGPMMRAHEETIDELAMFFEDLTREQVKKKLEDMLREGSSRFFQAEFESHYKEK